jgi:hypothetical protein
VIDNKVTPARWRAALRRIRRIAPVTTPVRFVRSSSGPYCAYVWIADKGHRIVISDSIGWQALIDSLLHEWTHVLRHEADPHADPDAHDDLFWIEFGALYRAWRRCK